MNRKEMIQDDPPLAKFRGWKVHNVRKKKGLFGVC